MDPSTPMNTRIVIPARPPVDNRPVGVDELVEEFYRYIDHVRHEPWAYLILHGMKDAKVIRRLVHTTQVDLPEKPATDGSNLYLERRFQLGAPNGVAPAQGSQAQKQMYDYNRAILTGIFSNNLIEVNWPNDMPATGNPPLDISKYTRLNWLLRACSLEAVENERARIDYPQWLPNVKTAFEWVPAWMLSIRDGVHAVQDAWLRAVDAGAQDQYMRQQMAQAWSTIPAITRLIMLLVNREDVFEAHLSCEHVEDILMDKRIHWLKTEDLSKLGRIRVSALLWEWDNKLRPYLSQYSRRMRQCHDYRQLVDWGYGRLWKKIYLVIGGLDETDDQEVQEAITMFRDWATSNTKLAWDLFGVHPIWKDGIAEDDLCPICFCAFEEDELVMQLHCDHRYHPACIYEHWDNDLIFNNPCPSCRRSQGILRDRLDFVAEKIDIDHGANETARLRDVNNHMVLGTLAANLEPIQNQHIAVQELYWRTGIQAWKKAQRATRKAQVANWDKLE